MFDKYLRDRDARGEPRWRRRLPFWLILAGAGFVMFVRPLIPFYVAAVAFYFAGRSSRARAWLIGDGDVPRTMLAGYALLMLVLAVVLQSSLTPADASDDAWQVMLLPAAWLALTAPLLIASAALPRHTQRERLLVGTLAAFVASGVVVVLALFVASIVIGSQDELGQDYRRPVALAAAICLALLLVVPLSVRRVASRAF